MPPKNSNHQEFGDYVRRIRNEKGVTLRKFAEMVDLSPSYISLIERGEQLPPGEDSIHKIAMVLGIDKDVLLAMAGKVSSELKDIIMEKPSLMANFLRTASGKSEAELIALTEKLRNQNKPD